MDVASYFEEDRIEADHWWFRGRRRLGANLSFPGVAELQLNPSV